VEANTVEGDAISQSFPLTNTFTAPFETATFSSEFRDLASVTFRSPTEPVGVFQIDDVEAWAGEAQIIIVEPDASSNRADISNLVEGVTLSSQGGDTSDNLVYAYAQNSPTGSLSFGWFNGEFFDGHWGRDASPALQADFSEFLAEAVSIDYEMQGTLTLEAFAEGGGSLGSVMADSGSGTLTFSATHGVIESVEIAIAPLVGADFGTLDHMVIRIPEPGRVGLGAAAVATLSLLLRRRRRSSNEAAE
jgi:hypothetical protein